MDEIDTLCKLSDKGGFTEFLTILKKNNKYKTLQKNINDKKKIKKTKTKILIEDYIKLYNPIICTAIDSTDKKITELKQYSEVINLQKPSNNDMFEIINDLYKKNNQLINEDVKLDISNYAQYDIRRLIIILEDLHYFSNGTVIDKILFEKFKKTYNEKYEEIQLLESTKILLTKKLNLCESSLYFDVDCLLTPLMIHHNSIDYIKDCEDISKKKLNIYKNVLNSICIHDTIQTNIFEVQDWDELYNVAAIYGSSIPNYYFNQLKNKKPVNIEFTSLLNKISQMFVNKKLLNSANYSIGKINIDTDELIYLTEIISHYFDMYKNEINDKDDDEDDDDDDKEEDKDKYNIIEYDSTKPLKNNSKLINFMNNYSMNIDCLENMLKIEKLNKINEKRKKKFTLKIKKDLSKFLVTK